MAFQRVGPLSQLPPGGMMPADIGGRRIAVCNVAGTVHAIDAICPHRGGPLYEGALHDNWVVCPWHAWEFDCVTGSNDYNPNLKQETYAVKVENGDIFVDA
jgi:nitrite reductase/ring-hydroxylating ferredoxin subunit